MSTKKTTNYGWLKMLSNNRKISKSHLASLRRQFDEYGNITEISPILVNKSGFILDGQHRRIICEERDLPIFYNEVDVKKEVTPAINSNQKKWSALDYIEFFAAYKPEYELLSRFVSKNEVNYHVAASALFPEKSGSAIYDRLTKGTLEISPVIDEAQKRMDIIHDVNETMGLDMTERYARGLLRCLYKENFDINRFVTKLKMMMSGRASNIPTPRATTTADVLRNIETIYNFKTREESVVVLFR